MPINLVGSYPSRPRVELGLLSLDYALARQDTSKVNYLGAPMGAGYTVYSKTTGIGKSVFTFSLAGLITAHRNESMAVMPTDTFDMDNMMAILEHAGVSNDVHLITDGESHNDDLKKMEKLYLKINKSSKKNVSVVVLDSAYACVSKALMDGKASDTNWGKDAKMVSTWVRQMYEHTRSLLAEEHAHTFFITNKLIKSQEPVKGFGPPPYEQASAINIRQLCSLHLRIDQQYINSKKIAHEYGKLLKVTVEKNNFGPSGRVANVFVVGGVGIHKGLTAVFDAIQYGIAVEKKNVVYLHGEDMGKWAELVMDFQNEERFIPFIEALAPIREKMIAGAKVEMVTPAKAEDDDEETDTVSEEAEETDSLIVPSMEE